MKIMYTKTITITKQQLTAAFQTSILTAATPVKVHNT